MKKNPTYKEQFDKLTIAYIAGKVQRLNSCACFIGNLLNGNGSWRPLGTSICHDLVIMGISDRTARMRAEEELLGGFGINSVLRTLSKECKNFYSPVDILELEGIFLTWSRSDADYNNYANEEDALFIGFVKTLERLKEIHISKGEIIDEDQPLVFKKRELQSV